MDAHHCQLVAQKSHGTCVGCEAAKVEVFCMRVVLCRRRNSSCQDPTTIRVLPRSWQVGRRRQWEGLRAAVCCLAYL